ncbi:MAG TPA: amidohydrolase family protein [Leifsonia sp.]|nr:amidohydrolase family protein [Leifsonia sp.]
MPQATQETTCIRAADWVIAYDAHEAGHVYLRGADVAFAGSTIVHVGDRFQGKVDREVPGAGKLIMPGLVNVHGHLGTEPLGKGFFEDLGNPNHYMSRLYEFIYVVRPPDAATRRAATRLSVAELLLSGCTTVADMSIPYAGWAETFAETGVRAYLAPMFKSASWVVRNDHDIEYEWDEAAGERDFAQALEVIEAARADSCGRLGGIVMPAQSDTCTPALLVAAHRAARERGFPYQVHSGQSVPEFHEMIRRHGKTSTQFLRDLGVLGPGTTVAHSLFIDRHPWIRWHEHRDVGILAETGTSVAHCPMTFAYRGSQMHDFGTYQKAGINMALGTDTHPHDMVSEMRTALFAAKAAKGHVSHTRTEDVFRAATLGGAAALGRDDLGRLAPGAKADLVVVDTRHPAMQPCRDPLRSFIYAAGDRAVTDVFVDGRPVIADRAHLTIDVAQAVSEVERGHAQAMREVAGRDWARRDHLEVSPLSLRTTRAADLA